MFFNQIPQAGGGPSMPPPPMGMPPGMPPGAPGMPQPMPPPGMAPPGMPPQGAPQQGAQGTPGLDILKLLMMMKRKGAGPMSGGVGDVPPPSLHMPYSLSPDGGQGGVYDLITKILGSTGQA